MSVWLDHVKETRKKCPGMSFKEVLKEAKKTYDKNTKKAGPVVCKSSSQKSTDKKKPSKRARPSKRAKGRKSRKTKRKKRKSVSKRGRGRSKTFKKIPKRFKCKMYPNAPNC